MNSDKVGEVAEISAVCGVDGGLVEVAQVRPCVVCAWSQWPSGSGGAALTSDPTVRAAVPLSSGHCGDVGRG